MCEMSNRPATFRTAICSPRIDVYCWGSSQPPKSTMRPPRATWRSYRGVLARLAVKFGALVVVVVQVDGLRVDEGEQFFVVPAPGVSDHTSDVERPLERPLKLFSEFGGGRFAVQQPARNQLGSLIVRGGGHEQLRFADGSSVGCDGGVHLGVNPTFGESGEVRLSALGKRTDRFQKPDGALLNQVGNRQSLLSSGCGQADDHIQVRRHEALLARSIAKSRALEKPRFLAGRQMAGDSCLLDQRAQCGGIV